MQNDKCYQMRFYTNNALISYMHILSVLAFTRGQLLCLYICPTCLELWPEAFKAMYPSGTPIKVAAFSSILFNFDS